jgi:hypothetical protein
MWLRLSTYPSNEARTYLVRLFNADKVRKPERGRYTPVATVATVAFDEATQSESNTRNTSSRGCTVCGNPLPTSVIEDGFTTHPTCADK